MPRFPFLILIFLIVQIASAAVTPRTCPTGITKDMTVNYNDYVSCQLDAKGEIVFFRFQGSTGEKIHIGVSANYNLGPCFALYDPSAAKVAESCAVGPYGSYYMAGEYSLARTGTFTVRIFDTGHDNTFSFNVLIQRYYPSLNATPIAYGQSLNARIDPSSEHDQWVFGASRGDSIAIQVNSTNNLGPCFTLFKPNGDEVSSPCVVGPYGSTVLRGEYVLTDSCTHMIRVRDTGADTSWDYSLFLQCLGACVGNSPVFPSATLAPTGCTTCNVGGTFSAKLTTTNVPDKATELKLGFYFPDNSQHAAGDPHLELPPGFAFDGEFLRLPITASHPKGNYRVCARIVELAAGDILAASCQSFVVQ